MSKTVEGVLIEKEFPVSWIRESRCRIRSIHRGVTIERSIAEFSDYYGFLTSLPDMSELRAMADKRKIDADTDLQIEAMIKIEDFPSIIVSQEQGRRTEWREIPDGWSCEEIPAFDRKRVVVDWTIVWSLATEAVEGYVLDGVIADLKEKHSVCGATS